MVAFSNTSSGGHLAPRWFVEKKKSEVQNSGLNKHAADCSPNSYENGTKLRGDLGCSD
jgi:hypothetical protein